jgi:pimeloyl-ACP methyl ester carboxylesterase
MRYTLGAFIFAAAAASQAQQAELPPAPGRLVDVGGRRLHVICSGSGSPTVILEAGASSFAIDWTLVQRSLARTARVCSYDRAGTGWSDPSSGSPSTPEDDLHKLLAALREPPPYVLVGASRGGLHIRAFQADYPGEVAGLVFVDPSTEDRLFTVFDGQDVPIASLTAEQLRSTLPSAPVAVSRRQPQTGAPFDRLPPEVYRTRVILDERLIASYPDTVGPDIVASFSESERALLARLRALRATTTYPLDSLPTVVLTRGVPRNENRETAHRALARLSANSRLTVVADAGHEIHLFKPTVVVQAIEDVIEAVHSRSMLRTR